MARRALIDRLEHRTRPVIHEHCDVAKVSTSEEARTTTVPGILKTTKGLLNDAVSPRVLEKKFSRSSLNLSATRNVALYPKLNLAFNRVKKNGNSTTVSLLHAMEKGKLHRPHQAKRQSAHLRTAKFPLLLRSHSLYYFVIVRNPYSRTLSAFLNKFQKQPYIERFGNFSLSPSGFEQFLRWLAQSGLEMDAHWDLQKKLILAPIDEFDKALRFEEFPGCLEDFLRERSLEFPRGADTIFSQSHSHTRTGANAKLHEFYSPQSIDLVKNLYRDDFEFLGYSKEL